MYNGDCAAAVVGKDGMLHDDDDKTAALSTMPKVVGKDGVLIAGTVRAGVAEGSSGAVDHPWHQATAVQHPDSYSPLIG